MELVSWARQSRHFHHYQLQGGLVCITQWELQCESSLDLDQVCAHPREQIWNCTSVGNEWILWRICSWFQSRASRRSLHWNQQTFPGLPCLTFLRCGECLRRSWAKHWWGDNPKTGRPNIDRRYGLWRDCSSITIKIWDRQGSSATKPWRRPWYSFQRWPRLGLWEAALGSYNWPALENCLIQR